MQQEQQTTRAPEPRPVERRIPGLEGVSGKLRIEVASRPARLFSIRDGSFSEQPADNIQADATIFLDDESDVSKLTSGTLNPIVAFLQGRLRIEGSAVLAARVILGLQGEASPAAAQSRSGASS
jgi:putative sterol carrier protein